MRFFSQNLTKNMNFGRKMFKSQGFRLKRGLVVLINYGDLVWDL